MKSGFVRLTPLCLAALFGLSGFCSAEQNDPSPLRAGTKIDQFKAKTDEDHTWKSEDYIGKKTVVIFFYPAAMTGG